MGPYNQLNKSHPSLVATPPADGLLNFFQNSLDDAFYCKQFDGSIVEISGSSGLLFVTTDSTLIGDGTPSDPLHVVGAEMINFTAPLNFDAGTKTLSIPDSSSVQDGYLSSVNFAAFAVKGNTNSTLLAGFIPVADSPDSLIDSVMFQLSGMIGLSTETPTAKLEILGDGVTTATFGFKVDDNTGANNFCIRDDGHIGIGTTNPSARVHIVAKGTLETDFTFRVSTYTGSNNDTLTISDEGEVSVNTIPSANLITGEFQNIFQSQQSMYFFQHLRNVWSFGNEANNYFITSNAGKISVGSFTGSDLVTRTSNIDRGVVTASGSFGIGTVAPDSSAILDIESTTLGFLPPQMTTVQKNAIAAPKSGLIVYDTTLNKISVFTGATWEVVTSV